MSDKPKTDTPVDEALRQRIAELEAQLAEASKSVPLSASIDDKAYAKSPKHRHCYEVKAFAGPKKGDPAARVENCCDESEAIRRYALRNGQKPDEHRYHVTKVEPSKKSAA